MSNTTSLFATNPVFAGTVTFAMPGVIKAAASSTSGTAQTTKAKASIALGDPIPLPASGVLAVKAEVLMSSLGTAAGSGAYFEVAAAFMQTGGVNPVELGANVFLVEVGSDVGKPPAGWGVSIQLDATGQNAVVVVTGDPNLTVDVATNIRFSTVT